MPQITHFQVENEKSPYRGKGDIPLPHSVTTLPRAWSLLSLAKSAPNVLANYATAIKEGQ